MRKGTPEQIAQRREEIINACEQLYQTTSFREITLKEIGKITSFSRPSLVPRSITILRRRKRSSWRSSRGSTTVGTSS